MNDGTTYGALAEGQQLEGFQATAIYLNDTEQAMGARFIHQQSGFTLDLIEIQSVPQAFVWVTTYPTSDMGEPHTQEHLLLGKGNKGRNVASHESMSLAASNAFTEQWRTCYHFYTAAGRAVFYEEFERRMDALLHPDYSDEEVHREVRHFGVAENSSDRSLTLDEKGTVYNEMVTSMDQPVRRLHSAVFRMIYGPRHPLQFNSGGTPAALRNIRPSDIQSFHASHYFLANMGAVISLPKDMRLSNVLKRFDDILNRIEPKGPNLRRDTANELPVPEPAPSGEIQFIDYPNENEQQPGTVWLAWPAQLHMDVPEQKLAEFFLESFAGDSATNLYRRFIDSGTRDTNLGAQSVFGSLQKDQGSPILIGFGDVPVSRLNTRDLDDVRSNVIEELQKVAAWKDGSDELRAFNDRVRSHEVQLRRSLAKFVNSPPGFGFRGTYSDWIDQFTDLDKIGGFRRPLTMKPVLDAIRAQLAENTNIWARYIERWKLTSTVPWIGATRPVAALVAQQQQERKDRIADEIERLKEVYGVPCEQDVLKRRRAEYDTATAVIDRVAAHVERPKFAIDPPMTLDDTLVYSESDIGGVPMIASTFDAMAGATTGISLDLYGVGEDHLLYVSLLPLLLTRTGVIENGVPVSQQEMSERLRNEIRSLRAEFSTNSKTQRVELTVRGSGNDVTESRRAIEWMKLVLFYPDWRPENLSRIRDLVDQILGGLRRTPQSSEENWVNPVPTAYWRQDNPLFLATTSFMTQTHHAFRLRWKLKSEDSANRTAVANALLELAAKTGTPSELLASLTALHSSPNTLLAEASKDIETTLADIPDSSLAIDWPRLCREMAADLLEEPKHTLAVLDALRQQILKAGNARMFVVSSNETKQSLDPSIRSLVASLDQTPPVRATYAGTRRIDMRLRERDSNALKPVFIGLLNPNSQGGVIIASAPAASYEDTDREIILDYLSANLYGGGGGHSMFMKTAAAGLAYSNGIGSSPALGRLRYYAERTPELPQTVRFVIEQLKAAVPDQSLVEYAIAQAFTGTRSAQSYESRGEAIAQNLADGITPELVTRFHRRILELHASGDLTDELYRRKNAVLSRVLPGFGAHDSVVPDSLCFVIGPEKQFAAWEQYLRSSGVPDAAVYRLYPRDFWVV